jgi:tetratricopeptide (TPR) repeat protein
MNADREEISRIEGMIDNASSEEEKVKSIATLAWMIKYSDPARAVKLADNAIEISQRMGIETNLPKCYLSKAMGLLHMSYFTDSEKACLSGLESYRKLNNPAGIRHALNVMGSIYFRWGKFADALENYLESLRIHLKLSKTPDPGILSNIGAVYLQLGDTDRALECYTQVKKMADKMDGPADLKAAAFINMGEIYTRMRMFDDALECLIAGNEVCIENDMKQAIAATTDSIGTVLAELGRYDEAMESFNKSLTIFKSLEDIKGEALVLSNIGKCSLAEGSGRAMEYYLESLKRFRILKDSQGISEALIGISLVMLELGRNDAALEKLNEALEVAEKKGLKPQLSEIHKSLSSILERDGIYDQAFKHLKLYHEIENTLHSERAANSLRSLRVIHQVEKARKEAITYILQNIELQENKDKLEEMVKSRAEVLSTDDIVDTLSEIEKQDTAEIAEDYELKLLTDRVIVLVQNLDEIMSAAINGTEDVLQNSTLSESVRNKLHQATDLIRDGFPLVKQLLSLCRATGGRSNPPDESIDPSLKDIIKEAPTLDIKILILEDESDIAEQLITTLEAYGYPVIVSSSLASARTVIKAGMDDLGCIFVDLMLPDGDGMDLIKEIRTIRPNFPILAGSGYPVSKRDLEYLNENGISFIQKPYKIDNLMLKLSTVLPL